LNAGAKIPDRTLIDPLARCIILHDHTWYGHILLRHPEIIPHRTYVEHAITDPLEIRFSHADTNCRLYFGAGPRDAIMTLVVADVTVGIIKTAHFAKSAKGAIEWSKPIQ
jgi:hypothetical protein